MHRPLSRRKILDGRAVARYVRRPLPLRAFDARRAALLSDKALALRKGRHDVKTYLPENETPPPSQIGATLEALAATIAARRDAGDESYTHRLLAGSPDDVLKKVMEESGEVALAAKDVESWATSSLAATLAVGGGATWTRRTFRWSCRPSTHPAVDHLRYEAADVVYHLLVVLERYGIDLDEFAAELNDPDDRGRASSRWRPAVRRTRAAGQVVRRFALRREPPLACRTYGRKDNNGTTCSGPTAVRGVANTQLTCDLAFKLGQAAVAFQGKTILIGKDTRLSGDMLESAVAAGIMSMGGTALLAGIIPTPAIALLVRELHCDGGIVISASHNPPEYNGIKLFDAPGLQAARCGGGRDRGVRGSAAARRPTSLPAGDAVGVALPVEEACELYIAHAVSTVADEGIDLAGLKVALDVGHGASCMTSAEALRRLGADVTVINEDFDGTDINVQCGSTHLGPVRDLVAEIGADVGIAHDGDADRVMLVDAHGNEIDGDVVEAVCAIDLKERGLVARQHGRVHGHVQPGPLRTRCAMRASSSSRRRWATATCWRPCARAASSWAASRAAT